MIDQMGDIIVQEELDPMQMIKNKLTLDGKLKMKIFS